MIKKLLVVLALLLGSFVALGAVAPPASANTCGAVNNWTGEKTWQGTSHAQGSVWYAQPHLSWYNCTDNNGVAYKAPIQYDVHVERTSGGCGAVNRYRINPDTLGGHNHPASDSTGCPQSWNVEFAFDAADKVYASQSLDNRTIGAYFTLVFTVWSDDTEDLQAKTFY